MASNGMLQRRPTFKGLAGDEIVPENKGTSPPVAAEDEEESPQKSFRWWQLLLKDPQSPAKEYKWVDLLCSAGLLICAVTLIIVVTVILVKNWEADVKVYSSNSPIPLKGYTCDCSLPLNFQDPDPSSSSEEQSIGIQNVNRCYRRSSLEDIRILQYPHSYSAFDAKVHELSTTTSIVSYVESEGYIVTQEAIELSIRKPISLKSLYRNEQFDEDDTIYFPLGYIRSAEFMTFPPAYIRMAFAYDCDNCSSCGLQEIQSRIQKVTGGREPSWASCYYWGRVDESQCSEASRMTYMGKCVLYPTETMPFAFAIKKLMDDLNVRGSENSEWQDDLKRLSSKRSQELQITNVGPPDLDLQGRQDWTNWTAVQPNVVYLNRSRVMKGTLEFAFVESPKGTTLHAWLVTNYPGLITECSSVPDVRDSSSVCNGSSVCNAFVNSEGSRSIQLRCKHMENDTQCEDLVKTTWMTIDNNYRGPVNSTAICHTPEISCLTNNSEPSKVPAYKVVHTFPNRSMDGWIHGSMDPLNTYLNLSTLPKEWLQRSGICFNSRKLVFRYNDTWFLQAKCNGTDLCTLTGTYYQIDDFHDAEERTLSREMFRNESGDGKLFVCYKVMKRSNFLWLIGYVNTLFSWLGVLLCLYVSVMYKWYVYLLGRYGKRISAAVKRWMPSGCVGKICSCCNPRDSLYAGASTTFATDGSSLTNKSRPEKSRESDAHGEGEVTSGGPREQEMRGVRSYNRKNSTHFKKSVESGVEGDASEAPLFNGPTFDSTV
ncbi:hypothetical protein R1flu_024929 [Riccia fluitans]|uniref:Uncharacterized protein n=1 Tax=Riccia fluitans TaxID=41844 RepID=A0ABD1XWA9_9MARC